MSPRGWQARLQDILTCSYNTQAFTAGMNFDSFLDDTKTIRAVAFELTTIGEAVRTIPQEIQEKYPEVPWGKIQGIRNILVHEYFRIGSIQPAGRSCSTHLKHTQIITRFNCIIC